MLLGNIQKKIYRKIKQFDTIVIARHIGADPDALASTIALRDVILNTFPNKRVYAIGFTTSKFKYLGILDKIPEDLKKEESLLIVTDTPDLKRIDGANPYDYKYAIKIDHHPFIEKYAELEWIDSTASSASQMIIELIFKTRLVMTKEAAEKLYIGLIADTNRFLFFYTTSKTFKLVSKLIETTNIDFTNLYEPLYLRPIKELKFQGYITENMQVTDNGFAYIVLDSETLSKNNVDAATARNMVSKFNYIEEAIVWGIFTSEKEGIIRGSLRSRGPIVNDIASHFNGGGHIYASGVRANGEEELSNLIAELDDACYQYKQEQLH